jgi:hypothetical protein
LTNTIVAAGITYSFGAVRAEKRHSAFSNKPRNTRTLLETDEGWQFQDQVHQVRSPTRQWIIRIVNDPWFQTWGAIMVFLDLVAMCFRQYDNTPEEVKRIDYAEVGFTLYFLVEIGFRIAGHSSWGQFWKKKSNVFDLFLAITTTIIILPPIHHWEWFRYLTAFQVMRSYRMIPAIPGVRDLMVGVYTWIWLYCRQVNCPITRNITTSLTIAIGYRKRNRHDEPVVDHLHVPSGLRAYSDDALWA